MATSALAYAQDDQGFLSPDHPMPYYWFRVQDSTTIDGSSWGPRLGNLAEAFGKGHYARAESFAKLLLGSTQAADIADEAASYLVELHLAQGNLAQARAVAARYGLAEGLGRIDRLENGYLSRRQGLNSEAAGADSAERRARALMFSAGLDRQMGRADSSEQTHWRVITEYPQLRQASRAAHLMIESRFASDDRIGAMQVCRAIVQAAPDGTAAMTASECLVRRVADAEEPDGWLTFLRQTVSDHPATRASDVARLGIGIILENEGRHDDAEHTWQSLVDERGDSDTTDEARLRLADLRYQRGMAAFTAGDYETAVLWLGRLLPYLESLGYLTKPGEFGSPFREEAQSKQQHALLCLGECYQKLGSWNDAAWVFQNLAKAGDPAEEFALFRAWQCLSAAGESGRAAEARGRLENRFPGSALLTTEHVGNR